MNITNSTIPQMLTELFNYYELQYILTILFSREMCIINYLTLFILLFCFMDYSNVVDQLESEITFLGNINEKLEYSLKRKNKKNNILMKTNNTLSKNLCLYKTDSEEECKTLQSQLAEKEELFRKNMETVVNLCNSSSTKDLRNFLRSIGYKIEEATVKTEDDKKVNMPEITLSKRPPKRKAAPTSFKKFFENDCEDYFDF